MRALRSTLATIASTAIGSAILAFAPNAFAQAFTFDTAHTFYHEAPTRTNMTVYTPGASLEVSPSAAFTVRGGYEADIVSGASVATKAGSAYQGTHPGADVITTASVHDVRNSANGGFTWTNGPASLTAGYAYSTEHDYKSNSINVAARTDAFDHNTQFEISYAHNFDRVCDRVQGAGEDVTRFVALESSVGCFTSDPTRTTRNLAIDGFQGSWTQAWTPIFATQLTYTAQVIDGLQSDPYRSIILGEGVKAQENEPSDRFRQSYALRANIYLRGFRGVLHIGGRGYFDTWGVKSATEDLELEKYLGEKLRVAIRGRAYQQTGAAFWSDDYTGGDAPLGPKGQYWTGDRELSPFTSWLGGIRASYLFIPQGTSRRVAGLFTSFKIGVSGDLLHVDYSQYTLGGVPITNANALILGLNATAVF